MPKQLPPLPALHAFEAAARHDGFQRAGEELHVSAGAIAHHVKQLEAWLGIDLFQRLPRGVVLTAAGQRYADALRPLLNNIADISEAIRKRVDERVVTVSATQSFATRWLMPRLGSLRHRHPQIDLRVLASTHPADFVRDGVDVAIRLGRGPYPGFKVDLMQEEWFAAVCSPAFRSAAGDLHRPVDLLRYTLLHDEPEMRIAEEIDWTQWLQAAGVAGPGGSGPRFSHTYLTLDAAASGQGIALAPEFLIAEDIRNGRLVRLFDQRVYSPYRYHLLRTANARPLVNRFCEWILEEVALEQGHEDNENNSRAIIRNQ